MQRHTAILAFIDQVSSELPRGQRGRDARALLPSRLCKGCRQLAPELGFRAKGDAYCITCRDARRVVRENPEMHRAQKLAKVRARAAAVQADPTLRVKRNQIAAESRARQIARNPEEFRFRQKANRKRWRDSHPGHRQPSSRITPARRTAPPTRPAPAACEACKRVFVGTPHADHVHGTDIFRGWLCGQCNTGIGMLGDNIEGLGRAIAYLEWSKAQVPVEKRWLLE